jgi:phosphohistidine phosphatase
LDKSFLLVLKKYMKPKNKRLILVRHAKSSWSEPGMADFDRPLNKRGEAAAPFMAAQWLPKLSGQLLLVSSSAARAKATAQYFSEALRVHFGEEFPIQLIPALYHATPLEIVRCVCALDEQVNEVLLFGHNPGISEAVTYLTGEPCSMPTCAMADISFPISSWKELGFETGTLQFFDYPKKYSLED